MTISPVNRHDNIDSLDGLRGFACLLVVLGHLAKEEFIPDIKGSGQLGVMLFFVLSGFLMAHLYTGSPLNGVRLTTYVIRRVFRVMPAYVFVAVASWILYRAWPGFAYAVDNATLIGLLKLDTQLSVFWTIPVEMKFYAFFPLLWLPLGYIRSMPLKSLLLLVAFVALLAINIPGTRLSLTKHIEYFIGGMLAAYVAAVLPVTTSARRTAVNGLFVIAIILVFLLIPQVFLHITGFEHHMWDNSAVIAPVFVLCVMLCRHVSGAVAAVFCSRPARYLGAISFSLYLVHYPCVRFVHEHPFMASQPAWLSIVAALGLALLVTSAVYYAVEQPSRRAGLWLCNHLVQRGNP